MTYDEVIAHLDGLVGEMVGVTIYATDTPPALVDMIGTLQAGDSTPHPDYGDAVSYRLVPPLDLGPTLAKFLVARKALMQAEHFTDRASGEPALKLGMAMHGSAFFLAIVGRQSAEKE